MKTKTLRTIKCDCECGAMRTSNVRNHDWWKVTRKNSTESNSVISLGQDGKKKVTFRFKSFECIGRWMTKQSERPADISNLHQSQRVMKIARRSISA